MPIFIPGPAMPSLVTTLFKLVVFSTIASPLGSASRIMTLLRFAEEFERTFNMNSSVSPRLARIEVNSPVSPRLILRPSFWIERLLSTAEAVFTATTTARNAVNAIVFICMLREVEFLFIVFCKTYDTQRFKSAEDTGLGICHEDQRQSQSCDNREYGSHTGAGLDAPDHADQ